MTDCDILDVLRSYPQIYLACHVEHRTRGSSPSGLTSRDASLLAHVEDSVGSSPAALARHLGISPSTLSAALSRLEGEGMLVIRADSADARRRRVSLTAAGRAAIADDSVLDRNRAAAVLGTLSSDERRSAVEGLKLLAEGTRRYRDRGED